MKVAEIAEFGDMRDELEAMSVAEVVIQPIVDETRDPPIAWQSVVILATPDARFFTPWVLAVRPTESDARRAVVELLADWSSLDAPCKRALPAVDRWNAVLTTQQAIRAVDAWRQHRSDDPFPAAADVRAVAVRLWTARGAAAGASIRRGGLRTVARRCACDARAVWADPGGAREPGGHDTIAHQSFRA